MEKNHNKVRPGGFIPYNFALKMKLTLLFLIVSLLQIQASTYAQNTKLTLQMKNARVGQVIETIESRSEFRFLFDRDEIDLERRVDVNVVSKKIDQILRILFKGSDTAYEIENRQISLDRKKQKRIIPIKTPVMEAAPPQNMVSGTVVDKDGIPIIGTNIIIQGTQKGTQTDFDGRYSIQADKGQVLMFSFLGYKTQNITVGDATTINITMEEDTAVLDEVVIVGYGEVKKSDLTGAVSVIQADELQNIPVARIDQALQGRATGVLVTTPSGSPTAAPTIQIRGGNSLTGDNRPLFVIDGFIVGTDFNLSTLNSSDVESIQVLKDATAVSIYGTRGANGVILITTKSGARLSEPEFNVNYYTGVSSMTRKLDLITGSQHAQLANDLAIASGVDPADVPFSDVNAVANTDWQDVISRTAVTNNLELSFGGNTENLNYYISTSYFNQEGIIRKSGLERFQTRFNFDYKVSDRFQLGLRANLAFTQTENNLTDFRTATERPGLISLFDEEGEINFFDDVNSSLFGNPEAFFMYDTNETRRFNLLANFYVQFEPAKDLVFRSTIGPNVTTAKQNVFNSIQIPTRTGANARVTQNLGMDVLQENTLTYTKEFGKHSLRFLGGFTWQFAETESLSAEGNNIPIDANGFNNIFLAEDNEGTGTDFEKSSLASFLGRIEYGFNDKYLLTLVGRRDGSSRFAPDNKWNNFYSISGAWNLDKEPFIANWGIFNTLKLRGGFGTAGSQGIDNLRTLATFSTRTVVLGDQFVSGLTVGRPENPELSWETTEQLDLGLEASFFKGALDFELGYYRKQTKDLLLQVAVPSFTGNTQRLENFGSIENSGLELTIGATIINKNDFRWTADMTISGNRSKVLDIGDRDEIFLSSGFNGNGGAVIKPGLPVGAFYGVESLGIWRDQAEIDAALADQANDVSLADQEINGPPSNNDFTFIDGGTNEGDIKLADTNGDGNLDRDDRRMIGDPNPDFFGGINNSFSYKNWSLDVYMQGTYGNDLYFLRETGLLLGDDRQSKLVQALDRWTPDNRDANYPYVGRNDQHHNVAQSRYIKDGSHLRIKTVRLTYRLPSLEKIGVKDLSLYLLADNLHVFSDYIGYDPEVNQLFRRNNNDNSQVQRGFDETAFPKSRTFTFGINARF